MRRLFLGLVVGLSVMVLACDEQAGGDAADSQGGVRINGLRCELNRFEEGTYGEDVPAFASPEDALEYWQRSEMVLSQREEWASLLRSSLPNDLGEYEFSNQDGWVQLIVEVNDSADGWRVGSWRACLSG